MSPKRIVFRVDASSSIGSGHVMRCLSLADACAQSGAECTFLSRVAPHDLHDVVRERGYPVVELPQGAPSFTIGSGVKTEVDRDAVSQADADAAASITALEEAAIEPDWIVTDSYEIDQTWEKRIRSLATRVLVIDDLANRKHDCDALLDQNLVADFESRYLDLTNSSALHLLGPTFALLGIRFHRFARCIPPRRGKIKRILNYFGAADIHNTCRLALEAFLALGRENIVMDLVMSEEQARLRGIDKIAENQSNVVVHPPRSDLAALIASADLAVGAAGTTTWERLCFGLPAIVITVAANQDPIARELDRLQLVQWLGASVDVDRKDIGDALDQWLHQELDESISSRCRELVDGLGAPRVASMLTMDNLSNVRVRKATSDDKAILLKWANDRLVRENAFNSDQIQPRDHEVWLHKRLRDIDNCFLYIAENDAGVPLGQVRIERDNGTWFIHYSVAPEYRGKGLGKVMIRAALESSRAEGAIGQKCALVKRENIASIRIFQSLGFATENNGGRTVKFTYNG